MKNKFRDSQRLNCEEHVAKLADKIMKLRKDRNIEQKSKTTKNRNPLPKINFLVKKLWVKFKLTILRDLRGIRARLTKRVKM